MNISSPGGMSYFDMGLVEKFNGRRKFYTYSEPKFTFVHPTYLFDKQSEEKEHNRKLNVWFRGKTRHPVDFNSDMPWWAKK